MDNVPLPEPGQPGPGRLALGRPVAIIDIGSNSVRLVAYEGAARALTPIYNEKVMCGLGRGVTTTGRLPEDAVIRALDALRRYRILCETIGAGEVHVLATAAARDAENGPDFIADAERVCGYPVHLLSGAREAQLSALGVVAGFHEPEGVVGDLGGGSLELIEVAGHQVGQGITLPLGGLALQDLSGGSVKKAQRIARETLSAVPQLAAMRGRTFYAVGGTWRALARLHMAEHRYPLRVMHGYEFAAEEASDLLRLVEGDAIRKLKDIDGISEARRPLLAYGAVVLEEILRQGAPARIAISALGVREGFLYEQLDPAQQVRDPLLAAAGDLNWLRSRAPRHGAELCAWTDHFMETLGIDETPAERRLRHAGCLLADTGWRAHPDYRGEQSLAILAHAAFIGIDHPGRAYLALAIFFRHAGLSPDKVSQKLRGLAGPRFVDLARLFGGLMRAAYPVSVAMAGVLPRTALSVRGNQIVLRLPSDMADLAGERLGGRLRQLGRLIGREALIEIG